MCSNQRSSNRVYLCLPFWSMEDDREEKFISCMKRKRKDLKVLFSFILLPSLPLHLPSSSFSLLTPFSFFRNLVGCVENDDKAAFTFLCSILMKNFDINCVYEEVPVSIIIQYWPKYTKCDISFVLCIDVRIS